MINRISMAAVIVGCLSVVGPVKSDEISDSYAKGLEHFRAENYQAALPHFHTALQLAEDKYGPDDPQVAIELNNLAEVYRLMGNYDAAEPLYERALELDEQNLDADSPELATSLNNLALLYRAQNRLPEAEALYERSLDILQNSLGPRHPKVAKSLNNLAVLYDAQGRRSEAATLIERAVTISQETLGPDHPTTTTLATNLETMRSDSSPDLVIAAAPAPAAVAKPSTQDSAIEQSQAETASVEAVASKIEPAAGNVGDFVIHLASVRSTSAAEDEWRRLVEIHQLPNSLSQHQPAKVTTSNGDFYRVWGGMFASEEAAKDACAPISAKGDYCKVMKVN